MTVGPSLTVRAHGVFTRGQTDRQTHLCCQAGSRSQTAPRYRNLPPRKPGTSRTLSREAKAGGEEGRGGEGRGGEGREGEGEGEGRGGEGREKERSIHCHLQSHQFL